MSEKKQVKKSTLQRSKELRFGLLKLIKEEGQKHKDGYCYLSNKEIGDILGSSITTISNVITRLVALGYLKREIVLEPYYGRKIKIIKELEEI